MPFIILDRDGVINFESDVYIKSPEEWRAIPGSLDAIARLNQAGFKVLVASNQSGVARELYDLDTLKRIHEKMLHELAEHGGEIQEIFFCPHHPDEKCTCRKPEPGLFREIQKKYAIDLSKTFFIGDSWSDEKVARAVGCRFILVLTGKGEKTLAENKQLANGLCFPDLKSAVDWIVSEGNQHGIVT